MPRLRFQLVLGVIVFHPVFRPLLLAALVSAFAVTRGAVPPSSSVAPGNFVLHPALQISVFAAEPDVVDPVALTFDEDGRIYVVEMRDYPLGIGPERRAGGTIRLLEDTDGDGRADRSTLFAEGLSFPTSVAAWKGGILVTAPPEILFLKDTNGDGQADVREVVFRGFVLGVTDSNVNGLRWGLDNRVHGANGGNGGSIVSTRKPGPPIALRDQDFSFDPESGDFTTTYRSSEGFGLVFDEWGRSFATYNINHVQHRVLPTRYLQRHPGLPPLEATVSISDHEEMSRIYPISTAETRPNHPEQAGHFSSAGGLGFIGTPAFPGDLPRSILVGDVVGNLVHRDVLAEDGPSFVAKRAPDEQRSEFFASRDHACRPIGMELGPDGALYLIDMQRDVIEHPDYIPEKLKQKLDLRAGDDRGRIYRITPKSGLPARRPNLSRAAASELAQTLSHASQWWRTTAQRLLVERQDKAAVPALQQLAADSREPLARLHALWALQGLRALEEPLVLRGLADPNPGVRENGLLLAESLLPGSIQLRKTILALADDPAARVRFQAALTIGQFEDPDANRVLLRILRRDFGYRWTRLAVLSSLRNGEEELLRALLEDAGFRTPATSAKIDLIRELADLIGARSGLRGTTGLASALRLVHPEIQTDEKYPIAALEGLHSGLSRNNATVKLDSASAAALEKIPVGRSVALLEAAWKLSRLLKLPETELQKSALAQAKRVSLDTTRPEPERLAHIRLLSLGSYGVVGDGLFDLLTGVQSASIQSAALAALQQFNEAGAGKRLIDRWSSLSPTVRPAVIELLLRRRAYHENLVGAVESGQVKLGELNLDLEQRRLLLRQSSPDIQTRAAKLFGDEEYSNRKAVVDEWLKKLPASGNPQRGRAVFEKTCAPCHVAAGLGHAVGPDLSDMSHRSVEDLLSNILDPNMAINPSYVSSNVELDTEELVTGILQSETAEAITVLQAQGIKLVLPRKKVKRVESSGLSLMPEGLEAGVTPSEMRDLIAFLQAR